MTLVWRLSRERSQANVRRHEIHQDLTDAELFGSGSPLRQCCRDGMRLPLKKR